ncbi:MAG: hypothetical protein NXI04_28945 [Planctomycetaceae bacterium]|nr:hypothetical protein [Planctomycetaceae bacterium]
MRQSGLIVVLLGAGLCGCAENETPVPPTREAPSRDAAASEAGTAADQEAGGQQAFAGLKFDVPASWQQQQLSPMQMGIVAAKFSAGADSDVQITLSRSSGGLEANLNRWRGQVTVTEGETLQTITAAGTDATLIKLTGDYSPGMGRPDLADGCLLGVIIPQPQQDYFIKATGPAASVDEIEDQFREFVASASVE